MKLHDRRLDSTIIGNLCNLGDWCYGEVWVPRPDTWVLEYKAGWHRGEKSYSEFERASQPLRFARGTGLPGRLWITRQPEWLEDVSVQQARDRFLRARLAKRCGLKAACGVPLLIAEQPQAVLVFFDSEVRKRDGGLMQTLVAAASQLFSSTEA